jgi:hypothetical protein
MDAIGKGGSLSAGAHAVDSMAQIAAYAERRGENYQAQRYSIAMVPAKHGVWYVVWEVSRHAVAMRNGGASYEIRKRELARFPFLQEAEEYVNDRRAGRRSYTFAGRFFKPRPITQGACP